MSDQSGQFDGGPAPGSGDARGPGIPPASIAHELTGSLRCVSCRYELRGLSIKGNCPECGLAVRATLLSLVDPHALELRPIRRPRLVAAGMLLWAGGAAFALVAGIAAWVIPLSGGLSAEAVRGRLVLAGAAALGLSGVGALAIVRPHAGIPRWSVVRGLVGVAFYPLAVALYVGVGTVAAPHAGATKLAIWTGGQEGALWRAERLAMWLVLSAIAWLLRPSLRRMAARSLVLRSRRVDRQTIAATAAALLVAAGGDAMAILAGLWGQWAGSLVLVAETLVAVAAALLALAVVGSLIDTVRIIPAVLSRPLGIDDVLTPEPAPAEESPTGEPRE